MYPCCDLQVQYQELGNELVEAARRVLASGQVILGPEVAALEAEVADYCGAGHAVGCSSGTDALLAGPARPGHRPRRRGHPAALHLLRHGRRGLPTGRRPVFVDIDPVTYNLDPVQVENKITPRTRAIMAVHLFGQCADMEPLWQIAERHNLPIVEDAAQAIGAEYQGKRAGTLGAIGCFSFYPVEEPRRLRRRRHGATNDPDWAASWPACASTAWSRSTITSTSAGTPASTRCRPPCCA